MNRHSLWIGAAAMIVLAADAGGQSIASRVRSMGSGTLRFSYDVRQGVCGNGSSNMSWNNNTRWSTGDLSKRRGESEYECEPGPARVSLEVDRGRVVEIRHYVGGRRSRSAEGEDLGQVSASSAEEYFETLLEGNDDKVAEQAIVPAVIAAAGDPYPELLQVAKDQRRSHNLRKNAIFWLGQEAGEVATRGLKSIVGSEDDTEVRKQAVFALSQQRSSAATDILIDIVRNNRDPELRKTALFWLGQSNDPRALKLIEELILKR